MMIGGRAITDAERAAVHYLQDWMRVSGGDSVTDPACSPAGDGRWVSLLEVFPRYSNGSGSRSNAQRQAIRRLHEKGVLTAYEIAYYGERVKAVRAEEVATVERTIAAMTTAERESLLARG